jgi:hypothetical protein
MERSAMVWSGLTLVDINWGKKIHNKRLQKELGLGDIVKDKCPDILYFPVILTTSINYDIF